MIRMSILGGIASGKSTVTKYLHELGACVFSCDDNAKQFLEYPEIIDQMEVRCLPMFHHWMPIFDFPKHVVRSTVVKKSLII